MMSLIIPWPKTGRWIHLRPRQSRRSWWLPAWHSPWCRSCCEYFGWFPAFLGWTAFYWPDPPWFWKCKKTLVSSPEVSLWYNIWSDSPELHEHLFGGKYIFDYVRSLGSQSLDWAFCDFRNWSSIKNLVSSSDKTKSRLVYCCLTNTEKKIFMCMETKHECQNDSLALQKNIDHFPTLRKIIFFPKLRGVRGGVQAGHFGAH